VRQPLQLGVVDALGGEALEVGADLAELPDVTR
jgi:hypothetical protein